MKPPSWPIMDFRSGQWFRDLGQPMDDRFTSLTLFWEASLVPPSQRPR